MACGGSYDVLDLTLKRCKKFGHAHSNDERKITISFILHFILDFRIWDGLCHQLLISS